MKKILQLYRDNTGRESRPVNVVRNASEASIYIYDVIDSCWGVSAVNVIDSLAQVSDADVLHVYINSPGGDVFEGRAIMAALSRFQGKTIAHIDSLCASAATSIALACNEVEMSDGAFFMIHNASCLAWGDKADLREQANVLEKIEGAIVSDYVSKTGKPEADIVAWMNEETWFTAAEALDNGFIDRIAQAPADKAKVGNAWNLSAYSKPPQALANAAPPNEPAKPKPKAVAASDADPDEALNPDEVKFLNGMIAHHQISVAMAKEVLPLATSDDVEDLAESIISRQAGEIELMKTWVDAGAAPEPDDAPEPANGVSQSLRNRLTLLQL
jgi:ATP-dependent protease ClpP protease subunit